MTVNSEEVIGSPTDSAQLNLIWEKGPFGARWQTNYVGAQLYSRTFNAESRDILEVNGDYVHNLSAVLSSRIDSTVVRLAVTNVLDGDAAVPDRWRLVQRQLRLPGTALFVVGHLRLRQQINRSPATRREKGPGNYPALFFSVQGSLTTSPMNAVPPVTLPAPHSYSVSLENSMFL